MKQKTILLSVLSISFTVISNGQIAWSTTGNSLTTNGILGTNTSSNFGIIFRTNGVDRGILTNTGNWGLGNNNPGANRLRVDGNQLLIGNLSFTNGLQSIFFGSPGSTNNAMMYMFPSGSTNAPRMVLAHSPGFPSWGLQYVDAGDRFEFLSAGTSVLSINLTNRFVGIGTTTASRQFEVSGHQRLISVGGSRFLEFLRAGSGSTQSDWRFDHNGPSLYISSSGNDFAGFCDIVRFGACTDTYRFTVYGNALASGGTWQVSDRKIKTNIDDVSNALALIEKLKPRTYYYKSGEFEQLNLSGKKQYGFVAQELEEIVPEIVQTSMEQVRRGEDPERLEELKAVNYTALIPLLVKSVQEQQQQIQKQQEQIETLTKLVERLTKDPAITSSANGGSLTQNSPNPVKSFTNIQYRIPDDAVNAQMVVYDNLGKTMHRVSLKGNGTLNFDATILGSGVYTYALVVDGKTVQSKKMTVAR